MTAVEWLVKMLYSPVGKGFIEGRRQIPHGIIEQAKAMEKEQILDARIDGFMISGEGWNGEYGTTAEIPLSDEIKNEQYYNETYNKA